MPCVGRQVLAAQECRVKVYVHCSTPVHSSGLMPAARIVSIGDASTLCLPPHT